MAEQHNICVDCGRTGEPMGGPFLCVKCGQKTDGNHTAYLTELFGRRLRAMVAASGVRELAESARIGPPELPTVFVILSDRTLDAKLVAVVPEEYASLYSVVAGCVVGPLNPKRVDGFVLPSETKYLSDWLYPETA